MRFSAAILIALVAVLVPAGSGAAATAPSAVPAVSSRYVAMRDGVRLAVDVWLPSGGAVEKRPAIIQFTRYWRALKATGGPPDPGGIDTVRYLTSAGYAVVIVDVRGTGASFGSRETEFSDAEVRDFAEVFDWIEQQPWSNGRVATFGSSYLGNTAELAAMTGHRALRAVVPRFSDFSEYRHAIRPGGVKNAVIADAWVKMIAALDRNDGCAAFGIPAPACAAGPLAQGVKPVDGDRDGRLLAEAVKDHVSNLDLATLVGQLTFADDPFGPDGRRITLDGVSPSGRWRSIDRSRIPAFHWASWFDGGTAEGVLTRFLNYRSPMQVIIGPWSHGGGRNADPYGRHGDVPAEPDTGAQLKLVLEFLAPLMWDSPSRPQTHVRQIRYFTLGVGEWRTTTRWPPAGVSSERYFFQGQGGLDRSPPRSPGSDSYRVDWNSTTGEQNRWRTQLGSPVDYGDRREQDKRLLTYTSAPMLRATEITGSPVVRVILSSTASDGAVFAYLEAVAPDGRVTYLSEGQLRLGFSRSRVPWQASLKLLGPTSGFRRRDSRWFGSGETLELLFTMNPISVVLPAGARIRVAIAGADAGTFERLPATGEPPTYTVKRNPARPSYIDIPIQQAASKKP